MTANTLLIVAHPNLRNARINQRLLEAVRDLPHVQIHDLYAHYPNFEIDVAAEQARLIQADHVVLQHPFYWYSSPALLKHWQDQVLSYGFAYGSQGTRLRGKTLLSAISTGGPEAAYHPAGYNHFTMRELLRPFEQTANLTGMVYDAPFLVHGSMNLSEADLDLAAQAYRARLQAWASNPPDAKKIELAA